VLVYVPVLIAGPGQVSPSVKVMPNKLSIVIPTYNRVELLKRAVESALAQEGSADYEIIVVDDSSQDNTWSYLQNMIDARLKTFHNEVRLGMGCNWNKAVSQSSGEYVFLLQDDDLAMPNLLARAAEIIDKYRSVDLICFATCLMDSDESSQRIFWRYPREELWPAPQALLYFAGNWTLSSTQVVFSRSLFDRYGGFDLTPPIMSDAEAILRWMVHADTVVIPDVLALRRAWSGSVTSSTIHSTEMSQTMQHLKTSVTTLAASSGKLSNTQLNQLAQHLETSFIEPYTSGRNSHSPASFFRRLFMRREPPRQLL
jgi:hypothetical protein